MRWIALTLLLAVVGCQTARPAPKFESDFSLQTKADRFEDLTVSFSVKSKW